MQDSTSEFVHINVGGTYFITNRDTLCQFSGDKETFFSTLLNGNGTFLNHN